MYTDGKEIVVYAHVFFCSTSLQILATNSSSSERGGIEAVLRSRGDSPVKGSFERSILPLDVSGKESMVTKDRGIMNAGSLADR